MFRCNLVLIELVIYEISQMKEFVRRIQLHLNRKHVEECKNEKLHVLREKSSLFSKRKRNTEEVV